MKKRDYYEDVINVLRILKEGYNENITRVLKEIFDDTEKPITDEQLYHRLLEKKENLTIYHNIVENDDLNKIITDGMNLNEIFDEDYLDHLDDY